MDVSQIYLYRITHIANVPHILKYGITHRLSPNHNENFVAIGDSSLIGLRKSKIIKVKGSAITLGDYIPFYFGVRMPMLYVIQHGYNCTTQTEAEDIIYLAINLQKIVSNSQFNFFFTDGHATDYLTNYYDRNDIYRLPDILDWEAIRTKFWRGEGVETDLKRRKQAEFLIDKDIPSEYIHGFICYNEIAKMMLLNYGVDNQLIKIFPQAYY